MSGPTTFPRVAPWRVGETAVYVVGLEGVIDALGEDTITINGITMPTRLDHDRGIRYLSMVWPQGDETTCDREHCAGACGEDADDDSDAERIAALEQAIGVAHYENHRGSFRFCGDPICRLVVQP